ncbi:MAG: P-loop NTPase, partial [Eggerthellaceae bacterium]|nr:P-loop NTPase [Eggerthellaceae bacterium]
ENLSAQPWLHCESDALQFRNILAQADTSSEAWVVSSDTMDAINIAAAIKHDNPNRQVVLVADQETGSVVTRARHAGIVTLWDEQHFVREFYRRKQRNSLKVATTIAPDLHKELRSTKVGDGHENVVPKYAPSARKSGTIFTLMSTAGGVGKSTLASVASWLLHKAGKRVVLLDADIQFGDCAWLNQVGASVFEFDSETSLESSVTQACSASTSFAVLACAHRPELADMFSHKQAWVLDGLAESFDVVCVNTGSFWIELHAQLIEQSDAVLFVLDQHSSSIRSTLQGLDLCTRMGLATHDFFFVVNKYSKKHIISLQDVQQALHKSQVFACVDGGQVIENLLAQGQAAKLVDIKNPFVLDMGAMLKKIFEEDAQSSSNALSESGAPKALIMPKDEKKSFLFFGRKKDVYDFAR